MKKNDIRIIWTTFFVGRKSNNQDQPQGRDRDYKRLRWHKSNKVNHKIKVFSNFPLWMVQLVSTVHCELSTQLLLFVSYRAMKANLIFKLDQFSFLNELR